MRTIFSKLKNLKWLALLGGLALLVPSVVVATQGANLELQISATCNNALILVNGRLYSGRSFTISVAVGSTVSLEIASQQLSNCGTQSVLHYFDRWDFNGEPYSKALRPLRLRAGQPPFMTNARVQAVFRAQTANLCELAISAQDALGNFLNGSLVEVRPLDILGDGDGFTPFVRNFDDLTQVLLRAGHQFSQGTLSYQFARWEVEGAQILPTFTADPTALRVRCNTARAQLRAIYELRSTPSTCPDLIIYRLEYAATSLGPNAWLFSPIAVVMNIGSAQTNERSTTEFFINGRSVGAVATSPLPARASEQASLTLLVADGSYLITAIADSKGVIPECNEGNNIKEIFVKLPPH